MNFDMQDLISICRNIFCQENIIPILPIARKGQSRVIGFRNFQVPSYLKYLKILKDNDSTMASVGIFNHPNKLEYPWISRPLFHGKMKSLYKYDLILVDPKKSFYIKRYYVKVVTKLCRLKIAPIPCFIPKQVLGLRNRAQVPSVEY